MVVICPKCKVKLKVADEKIAGEGTRFKCPKCSTVLLVRRPVPRPKALDTTKVLVAHEDPSIVERITKVLTGQGYKVIRAADGIEAMVSATREMPFLIIINVLIPKVYGFEVCKRLKARPETKEMKVILLAKVYDKNKYRREPETLYSADGYLEEHQIEDSLMEKIALLKGLPGKESTIPAGDTGAASQEQMAPQRPVQQEPRPPEKVSQQPQARTVPSEGNAQVERAKRLARTILSDIYLYSKAKVDEAVRSDTFVTTFAPELKEGLKLYENRIPRETRALGDFYNEAINNFIAKRKTEIT